MPARKIATCCYCGTRAALVLKGRDRHELACSSCGAPLHDLKQMPMSGSGPAGATAPRATPARPAPRPTHPRAEWGRPERPKHMKKRKSGKRAKKIFEEIWDVVEDIFD